MDYSPPWGALKRPWCRKGIHWKDSYHKYDISKFVSQFYTHMPPYFFFKRDDVAHTLALLLDRPESAGLAIDIVGGEEKIEDALDVFIKKGETDFLG